MRLIRFGMALVVLAVAPTLAQDALDERALKIIGPPAGEAVSGAELQLVTDEVTSLMRCPVCQGLSVADSPTLSAQAMMAEIRDLLAAGYSDEQVIEYFERSYGEFIRLAPKARGFNLVVWIAPAVALLLGFLLVLRRLRNGGKDTDETVVDDELAPYLERVRREVGG